VFITSVEKHRPPDNRRPTREEIEASKPILLRQIPSSIPASSHASKASGPRASEKARRTDLSKSRAVNQPQVFASRPAGRPVGACRVRN
jgi:uracil-DNA glycosylase family 4